MNLNLIRRWTGRIAVLAILSVVPAAGEELTKPLTAEEAACDERQLEALLQRMNAAKVGEYDPPELPKILLVSRVNGGAGYDGLVATSQNFRLDLTQGPPTQDTAERYLAFNLNPAIRTLLLNPDRPELAQVGLNREKSNSNLVQPGGYFDIALTLDPTLGTGDRLIINNFEEPPIGGIYNGFRANDTKPGRGLTVDGLLTPCHQKLTELDRHVFSILQRLARANDLNAFLDPDMEAAIFRGEDPHLYRINFYPVYEAQEVLGRVAVELRILWDEHGRLTTAEARTLDPCTAAGQLGCTSLERRAIRWFLIPPVFGGIEKYAEAEVLEGGTFLWPDVSPPRTLDLAALLAGTTWNEPVW